MMPKTVEAGTLTVNVTPSVKTMDVFLWLGVSVIVDQYDIVNGSFI